MDTLYLRPVFDEWAVLSRSNPKGILFYAGPRAESFRKQLAADTGALRGVIGGRTLEIGDFEFATAAGGTQYDACVKIGPTTFLVFNHTERDMAEIRQDPNWLKAQTAFFDLCEKFRADPLQES